MTASLLAELAKLSRRPALWVIGGVLLSAVVVMGYLFIYLFFGLLGDELGGVGMDPAELVATLLPANVPATAVGYAASFGGPAALVLGVLTAGSEYSWRTVRTIVTQGPARAAILAGKVAALALLVAVGAVALLLVALASAVAVAAFEGDLGAGWPAAGELAAAAGACWLVLGVWGMLGLLLGVVFRGTGLAIGLGLVYALLLEGLVVALPISNAVIDAVRRALISTNGGALANHLGRTMEDMMAMSPAPVGPGQAAAVLLAYAAVFAAGAVVVFSRREVG